MMGTKWKRSQSQTGTPVTGVGESTSSEAAKSSKPGSKDSSDSPYNLKVLGEKVLVEEEPIDFQVDEASGLSEAVIDMLKSGKLALPDDGKYFASKYPCIGTVLSVGERVKKVSVGDRIHFAQLGVQRFEFKGTKFLVMHEADVHGTYAPVA